MSADRLDVDREVSAWLELLEDYVAKREAAAARAAVERVRAEIPPCRTPRHPGMQTCLDRDDPQPCLPCRLTAALSTPDAGPGR